MEISASGLPSNGEVNHMDKSLEMTRTWSKENARPLKDTGFL